MIFEVQRSSRSEARKEEIRKQELEVLLLYSSLFLIIDEECLCSFDFNDLEMLFFFGLHKIEIWILYIWYFYLKDYGKIPRVT